MHRRCFVGCILRSFPPNSVLGNELAARFPKMVSWPLELEDPKFAFAVVGSAIIHAFIRSCREGEVDGYDLPYPSR